MASPWIHAVLNLHTLIGFEDLLKRAWHMERHVGGFLGRSYILGAVYVVHQCRLRYSKGATACLYHRWGTFSHI